SRSLAARQDEVAQRELLGRQPVRHSLVHILVVAAEKGDLGLEREPYRILVPEPPATRRKENALPSGAAITPPAERLHRREEGLRLQHHPGTAPVGIVVDRLITTVSEIPQIHEPV